MSRLSRSPALVSVLLLVASVSFAPCAVGSVMDRARRPANSGEYASTRIIVRFVPKVIDEPAARRAVVLGLSDSNSPAILYETPPARANAALRATWNQWGVVGMRRMHGHPFGNAEIAARHGLDRTFTLEVPPDTDTLAMAEAFASLDDQIEFAEVDGIGEVAQLIPNDEKFWQQWAMHNTGQLGGLVDADIDAPEAWAFHTGDVGTVTVAIVDTGVDSHDEFKDRMVAGINTTTNPYDDDTADSCYIYHGTHVAGIVAATGNNQIGVAGVTWGASIMPVRVFNGCGGYEGDTAEGIIWAVDNGADIINISLQFPTGGTALRNAVNYAYDSGVLVIGAAGNNSYCGAGGVVCAPARFANCMAVSGTNDEDVLATTINTSAHWSSNYGDEIDVCAPGDLIWSTSATTGYRTLSGTSMSTPHVSGLAALLKSYVPQLTRDDIWAVIADTADDLGPEGWDDHYGHGRINAHNALLNAGPTRIIASSPPDGAIDARQPSEPDGSNTAGWQWVDLDFGGDFSDISELLNAEYTVTQEGGNGSALFIAEVLPVEGEDRVVRVVLNRAISERAWTTIMHVESGTSVCVGYLPGDVNADRTTAPLDILRLVDALNEVVDLPIWSTDVDRSSLTAPPDILREIDLLNGAGVYESYLMATLPP